MSPVDGAQVSGRVTVNVSAADDRAVTRLALLVNGRQIAGTTNSSSLSYVWDASRLRGRYTLTATAYDAAGNQSSASVSVRVSR